MRVTPYCAQTLAAHVLSFIYRLPLPLFQNFLWCLVFVDLGVGAVLWDRALYPSPRAKFLFFFFFFFNFSNEQGFQFPNLRTTVWRMEKNHCCLREKPPKAAAQVSQIDGGLQKEQSHGMLKKSGLPGGPVVKTPCLQCRSHGFNH